MKRPHGVLPLCYIVTLFLLQQSTLLLACLWDKDTLADEQRGLPDMTAIIVGRYERHTPEFFQRRIRLAEAALAGANPAQARLLLDDIGVAHDRLNQQKQAIAAMQRKIARYGVDYRTAANLGTFYAHAGDLKQGEMWIRRALKINPQAHFGREWVQLRAIEYFRDVKAGKDRPFWNDTVESLSYPHVPNAIVREQEQLRKELKESGLPDNALEATAALIKMGDRSTPEMHVALAQLLTANGYTSLAIMAYWRAAELAGLKHPQHKEWKQYGDMLLGKVQGQGRKLNYIEKLYATRLTRASQLRNSSQLGVIEQYIGERDYAKRWVAAYQEHERALIQAGRDPEDKANFTAFYARWSTPQQPFAAPGMGFGWKIAARIWSNLPLVIGSLVMLGFFGWSFKRQYGK